MSATRAPVVVRRHAPNESSQLEALKMLLERGSKTAVRTSDSEDAKKGSNDESHAIPTIPG